MAEEVNQPMQTIVREKQWRVLSSQPGFRDKISSALKISPLIAQILINRGITNPEDAKSFLTRDINQLHSPFLMEDMEKVTKRILSAIQNKENITIYGDYDADGICGTALLTLVLQELGGKCRYYLPNRMEEGYGLNKDAILRCKEDGTQLLITVDCGIGSQDEINYAKGLGMDVIVTDHHSPIGELPECLGILNPKDPGSGYPYKELSGVGVAYKLGEALAKETSHIDIRKHLDLVAVGTIADIVPLTGENRIFVYHGLKVLETTEKIGLVKLKEKAGMDPAPARRGGTSKDIQAGHVAFRLAPRINAAGRLTTAESAIKLLLTKDENEAEELSNILNINNRERQKIEQEVLSSALEQLELKFNFNNEKIIVLENKDWPVGVIGIVAGRIANQYHRPCIIISVENGLGKGSGRSIKNFHLLEALQSCSSYLKKFGGHAHAAGLCIEEILIQSFREKINQYAESVLGPNDLIPQIEIDAEANFRDISFELLEQLDMLEPFGYSNPKPCLVSTELQLYREPRIVGNEHLKFWVKSSGRVFEAIGFGMAGHISLFDEFNTIDMVYRPQINNWMNREIIQLQVLDLKVR